MKKLGVFSALLGIAFLAYSQDPAPGGKEPKSFQELTKLAKTLSKMTAEERTAYIADVKSYLQVKDKDLRKEDVALVNRICSEMEKLGPRRAGPCMPNLGGVVSKVGSKEIAKAGSQLVGTGPH